MRSIQYPHPPQGRSTQLTIPEEGPFYGHKDVAEVASNFITRLFSCSQLVEVVPQTRSIYTTMGAPLPRLLSHFIAYAIQCTIPKRDPGSDSPPSPNYGMTYFALLLLQRLRAFHPLSRGSSGLKLFIPAFMISNKVICDDTYWNTSWVIVAQNMFTLREINQMEREMCGRLEWSLTVDTPTFSDFKDRVRKDFLGPGPYPTDYRAEKRTNSDAREVLPASDVPRLLPPSSDTATSCMGGCPLDIVTEPGTTLARSSHLRMVLPLGFQPIHHPPVIFENDSLRHQISVIRTDPMHPNTHESPSRM